MRTTHPHSPPVGSPNAGDAEPPSAARGRRPLLVALAAIATLLFATAAPAQDDDECLSCHDAREGMLAGGDVAESKPGVLLDAAMFARSVHGGEVACADCHIEHEDFPHADDAMSMTCAACHGDAASELEGSVHAGGNGHEELPLACSDCHGVHDVLPPEDREARLNPLNVYKVCGQCHFDVDPATATVDELLRDKYTDDVHADGILRAGLTVSATCVSCHGGHDIRHEGDVDSAVARTRIDQVCGTCHVGVLELYQQGVHHLNGGGNGHEGATCSDCHRPHEIAHPDDAFRGRSVSACTNCHKERAGSFRLSYHGKANVLGVSGEVATCEACHGPHKTLPASDPESWVHPDNVEATCAKCHEGVNAEFANYLVHADPSDGENFPTLHLVWKTMNTLLICVLILGGLHALMWLVRATADGHWRRPKHAKGRPWVRRWPTSYVVYHMWMMSTVLLLAGTGLPLHYADQPWAMGLMNFFGGAVAAGWVHRLAAIGLGALFAAFIGHTLWRIMVKREKGMLFGPNTMLPRVQDLQDLWANIRWFLFLAPRPRFDRWTYWEKFDFWAATWGLFVIGLSGLMLWFPETATLFVPGWMLNAAVIVHGIEALLDIAFIFTVHVFHANLRPDKFPIDTMFLTGRMPAEEFEADRPLEYERAQREGTFRELAAKAPSYRLRGVAYLLGAAAFATGFFFVVMMIVALIRH
jgi:cytochrome b subunit of formate dehydrogenase